LYLSFHSLDAIVGIVDDLISLGHELLTSLLEEFGPALLICAVMT
jgi:hypothetical protein